MERAARNEATGRAAMATLSVTKMEARRKPVSPFIFAYNDIKKE